MMPAQLVAGCIAMCADAGAQPLHLGDERVAGEGVEVFVHSGKTPKARASSDLRAAITPARRHLP
jgi:hypothetical protein